MLQASRPVGGRTSMGADASTLKKHLETASKTGALNLSDMKLKKVHEKILALSNLRTLDLSKNQLTEIPDQLGAMLGMKQFNVSYNAIPQLPPAVRALPLSPPLSLSLSPRALSAPAPADLASHLCSLCCVFVPHRSCSAAGRAAR